MGSGGCAEVTLVTLVALRGVVIGQDVAIELQQCSGSIVLIISSSSKEDSTWSNSSFLTITCFGFILSVLASLSGFNFSLNSVTCFTAECFCSSVLLRFDAIPKAGKDIFAFLILWPFLKAQPYMIQGFFLLF